jgi:hypothetical protein
MVLERAAVPRPFIPLAFCEPAERLARAACKVSPIVAAGKVRKNCSGEHAGQVLLFHPLQPDGRFALDIKEASDGSVE